MHGCRWTEIVAQHARVVLKPNLTCLDPAMAYAANTSTELVAAVVRVLQERTADITVGESDMINAPNVYPAELAFEVSGLDRLSSELGFKLVNWSKEPTRPVPSALLSGFEMPIGLLDADVVISLPVLKTHGQSYYTGALKNMWGCVPRFDRFLLHRRLHECIAEVNAILRPSLAIMDAIVGIEGRGPTYGNPRRLDLVLSSTDLVALDATAARLVGLDPGMAKHISLARRKGLGETEASAIIVDGPFAANQTTFTPARYDIVLRTMDFLSPYRWFTYGVLLNPLLFERLRSISRALRRREVIR